jgi:hypothetical protein
MSDGKIDGRRAGYLAAMTAGAALAGGGAIGQSPIMIAFGAGLVFFGLGEWISHPYQQTLIGNGYGGIGATVTGYPRRFKFFGVLFTGLGIVLILAAAGRLMIQLYK